METPNRDPHLWQKAKARTKFQAHLVTYVLVNCGLWVIWALTDRHQTGGASLAHLADRILGHWGSDEWHWSLRRLRPQAAHPARIRAAGASAGYQ